MNKLALLLANYDLNNFYTVSIWQHSIDLQGNADNKTIEYCKNLGFEFNYEGKFLKAKKEQINITLTF